MGLGVFPLYACNRGRAITVTGVNPSSGTAGGLTNVTVTGTGFIGATDCSFGGTSATNLIVIDDNTITCDTPSHAAGIVDVTVTSPLGMATGVGLYTFTGG